MLYIIHRGNNPELDYQGGQRPIVHLQADLAQTVAWADQNRVRWTFSDKNAGAFTARFFNKLADLDNVNWNAVRTTDFRDMIIKEGKQAEFLVYDACPWTLVEKVGVIDKTVAQQVVGIIAPGNHRPPVRIERGWYY